MIIKLFKTKSENNVVYKTLENELSYNNCVLKESSSIINPVIYINAENLTQYNYCYIPEFNRCYYITDVVSEKNNLWKIMLKVDVLMSFKANFSSFDVIVERSEKNYNKYINDRENITLEKDNIQTIKFPITPLNKQMCFILTTVGGV